MILRRHTEVALNGYRVYGRLATSLVIGFALLLLSGCQGLTGNSNTAAGTVGVASTMLNFGAVPVGSSKTMIDTLTNGTSSPVTISAIQGVTSGFKVTGISVPLVLAAMQSVSFSVQFQPAGGGDPTAKITFVGSSGQAYASFSAEADAVTIGKLSPTPATISFGNVKVGTSQTSTVTLANGGGSDIVISQATMSGAGFTMSNLAMPLTVSAGSSSSVKVTFAPPAAGNFTGSVTFATASEQVTGSSVLSFSGTGVTSGALSATPSSLAFGSIQLGGNSSKSVTLTNTGGTTATISQVTPSGAGFSVSGLAAGATIAANQSVNLTATFAPNAAGAVTGAVNIVSDASNSPLSIAFSGTGLAAGSLSAGPGSVSFGNVTMGNHQTVPVTVTNTGGTSVTLSSVTAGGASFSVTGTATPVTLSAGQGTTFNAVFTPTAAGAVSGTLSISSNASNATLSVPLSGTGVTQGQLGSNPSSFSFGTIQVSSSKSLSGILTNNGGTSLTISSAAASGTGFSLSGLATPVTLTAGQSTSFTVLFSPTASGGATGSVSITSSGSNPNLSIPLSGTGATAGALSANPTSLAFPSTQVGTHTSLSETVTNTGGSTVAISQVSAAGAAFSTSGLPAFPINLASGQSVTFDAIFTPTTPGAASGSLSVASNASNSSLAIGLSGTGTSSGALAVSPTSLSFGNVVDGSSSMLSGTLTASGASVSISSATLSNGEFALSGISLPVTLTAGQSANFNVTFTPGASGAASASLSFVSNASNSPATQSMTGSGTAPTQHTVDLTWTASTNAVGYNIYRSTTSGGPYTMINSSLDSTTGYADSTVVSGETYYYVAAAVDSSSNESGYSNQAQAVIPTP